MDVNPSVRLQPTPRTVRVTPSFRSPIDSPARVRLFCFPYAGGGAPIFRAWSRKLESDIEVVPALLPGRESRLREPAHRRLDPLIDALASDIFPYLDKPFAFFGHSMVLPGDHFFINSVQAAILRLIRGELASHV